MTEKKFDPSAFVHTAHDTWKLKLEYDKFLEENKHLAAPFHITGLEDILPHRLPSETEIILAKSHHGKSTALRNDLFKAQQRIENTKFVVGVVSLEDSAETNAAKIVHRYKGNPMEFMDDQMVFIGNTFNMKAKDMSMLNIDNIIECLEYGIKMLPEKIGYSHIFLDYAQIVPMTDSIESNERRNQIMYAVQQLFNSAKQFKCPISFASQAMLKEQRGNHTSLMRIPGASDTKEAAELYEIPDIAISYWQPKHEPNTPIGTRVEDGGWSFTVEANLMFIKILKWRNAELKGFVGKKDIIGRVFPCRIQEDGEITYDKKEHSHMTMMSVAEKESLT